MQQVGAGGVLGVAEPGLDPQVFRLPGRRVQGVRVLHREQRVRVAVHDQEGNRGDPGRRHIRWFRHLLPTIGRDPGASQHPACQPPEPLLDHPVHPPHRRRVPVEPPGRAADGHHRRQRVPVTARAVPACARRPGPAVPTGAVPAGRARGVPDGDRRAHGETDGRHPWVAERPGPGDRRRQVPHLPVTDGGEPVRPAVTTEVEAHHTTDPRQRGGGAAYRRAPPGAGEAVRYHDAQGPRAWVVVRLDPYPIVGRQRGHHTPQPATAPPATPTLRLIPALGRSGSDHGTRS